MGDQQYWLDSSSHSKNEAGDLQPLANELDKISLPGDDCDHLENLPIDQLWFRWMQETQNTGDKGKNWMKKVHCTVLFIQRNNLQLGQKPVSLQDPDSGYIGIN